MQEIEESNLSSKEKAEEILKALKEGNTHKAAPPMNNNYCIRKAEDVYGKADVSRLSREYKPVFEKLMKQGLIKKADCNASRYRITEKGLNFLNDNSKIEKLIDFLRRDS